MRHVFVETNWVVDWGAPAHLRHAAALELEEKAAKGDVFLHVPAFCLSEAKRRIRTLHPKLAREAVGSFLPWAHRAGYITKEAETTVRQVLGEMDSRVKNDLDVLNNRLGALRALPGIDVFPLDEEMLEYGFEIDDSDLGQLQPIDKTILSSVLVRSRQLAGQGVETSAFCEKDRHLQPWDKDSKPKATLAKLYGDHRIRVYSDYALTVPAEQSAR